MEKINAMKYMRKYLSSGDFKKSFSLMKPKIMQHTK